MGLMPLWPPQQEALYMKGQELTPQLSQSSVLSLADSHTEFFDACEVLLSASSSENEVRAGALWQSGGAPSLPPPSMSLGALLGPGWPGLEIPVGASAVLSAPIAFL